MDPFTRQVRPIPREVAEVQEILGDRGIRKVWFNLSYDLRMLQLSKFTVRGQLDDTLMMMHVLTGGGELRYALKPLCDKFLDYPAEDEKALQEATIRARNKGKKLGWCLATKEHQGREPIKADYWMAPPELCERYAVGDAERTMLLYLKAKEEFVKEASLDGVYCREMELFDVVYRMENLGMRMFPDDNLNLTKFYESYMKRQVKLADTEGGAGLNFRSPKQMHAKFYDERGHQERINERGNRRLNGSDLLELSVNDRLAKAILEYRAADHTVRSFLNVYERFRTQEGTAATWVLHPNFRQVGPVTGRMSCSDPNLMTVASATTGRAKADITYRQREVFGPREGCLWYLPDYSQIEVWVFAALAEDHDMLETMLQGHDAHDQIAREVWGHLPDYEANRPYYRKRAKLVMFCYIYGGGVKKLALLLECAEEESQKVRSQLHQRYPGVNRFMKRMINRATREQMITNPFGRRYFFSEDFAYKAVNYLVQGTAADILKNALIRLHKLFQEKWPGVELLLPLHDEIVIEVPRKFHSKKLMRDVVEAMQADSAKVGIPVPLPVGMKTATRRWSETQNVDL